MLMFNVKRLEKKSGVLAGSSQTAHPTGVTAAVGGDANTSLRPTWRFVIELGRPGANI